MAQTENIKIAIGVPLSGRPAALGREMVNAAVMAIEDANHVHGLSVEPWVVDDQGDEAAGLAAARAIVADARTLAVVGHYNSNVSLAAGPLYAKAGIAVIAPIVSNPRLTESGWANVFRFTNRDDATADVIAGHLVSRLGKRRAAVIATRTVYGESMSDEFMRAFASHGGGTVAQHRIDEGEIAFSALIRALPKDADMVFYGGTFEGAPLLRALREQGFEQLLATGDGCWDIGNFVEPAGAYAESGEGVLVLSACPEVGIVSGAREFTDRYEARFGPLRNYAVNAYDATATLMASIAAIAEGGCRPERSELVHEVRGLSRQGIAYPSPIVWNDKGDNLAAVTALHVVAEHRFRQVALA